MLVSKAATASRRASVLLLPVETCRMVRYLDMRARLPGTRDDGSVAATREYRLHIGNAMVRQSGAQAHGENSAKNHSMICIANQGQI